MRQIQPQRFHKIISGKKTELEKIYIIFPIISNKNSLLMLYIIFFDNNFIPLLSNLLVMTEEIGVLDNYINTIISK